MIRDGGPRDVEAVLAMFDSAVAFLVSRGRTGQWGSLPFSGDPQRIEQVRQWAAGDGMRIAELDDEPAGCVVVGPPNPYVAPVPEPELYVRALVIDQRFSGRGVGRALLDWSAEEAVRRGVRLLRVDCYAGDDGRLVTYYERCGFTRSMPFFVGAWPGMVLQRRLTP
ncbi:GNAT family N-acetyltransferase [Streptosporangium sp. NPDC050855]|uniref:GNAT family N-acetyltransferase n=1 Tax=Streptosporangium sp. NPDC050855 TaxID=3366194 RepID=UPI00379B8E4F